MIAFSLPSSARAQHPTSRDGAVMLLARSALDTLSRETFSVRERLLSLRARTQPEGIRNDRSRLEGEGQADRVLGGSDCALRVADRLRALRGATREARERGLAPSYRNVRRVAARSDLASDAEASFDHAARRSAARTVTTARPVDLRQGYQFARASQREQMTLVGGDPERRTRAASGSRPGARQSRFGGVALPTAGFVPRACSPVSREETRHAASRGKPGASAVEASRLAITIPLPTLRAPTGRRPPLDHSTSAVSGMCDRSGSSPVGGSNAPTIQARTA